MATDSYAHIISLRKPKPAVCTENLIRVDERGGIA